MTNNPRAGGLSGPIFTRQDELFAVDTKASQWLAVVRYMETGGDYGKHWSHLVGPLLLEQTLIDIFGEALIETADIDCSGFPCLVSFQANQVVDAGWSMGEIFKVLSSEMDDDLLDASYLSFGNMGADGQDWEVFIYPSTLADDSGLGIKGLAWRRVAEKHGLDQTDSDASGAFD